MATFTGITYDEAVAATGRHVVYFPIGGLREGGVVLSVGSAMQGAPLTVRLNSGAEMVIQRALLEFNGDQAARREADCALRSAAYSGALGIVGDDGCYCVAAAAYGGAPCGFCLGPHIDGCVWPDTGCSCFGYEVSTDGRPV